MTLAAVAGNSAIDGVPTLDAMAGDWLPMNGVANPPDVHNFNQMLIVGRDLTSYYCNPGGLFTHTKQPGVQWAAGYPLVKMAIDRMEYPAEETRCYAYKALRRNLNCNGIAVETDTRMVIEQRGVLCRITATNTAPQLRKLTLTLSVPGTLQPDGLGVANSTQRHGITSVVRPSRTPDSTTADKDGLLWTWILELPPGGKASVGYVAGDDQQTKAASTDERVKSWANGFDAAMDECEQVWKQRWADAFTPGNRHFSGNLPALKTDDTSLARNYYMGVETMLILERTQFPVSDRSFITSGERGDGIQYYWDASMEATAWALLEPAGMKATLRRWLVQNPRSGAHTSVSASKGYDAAHYDQIKGYAFNACTIFKTADEYLRITGDLAFLDEKLEDGKTVLDHIDALATDCETLPKGPGGLVDYGRNGNLLECAPAYTNFVPSLNAQDIWMMRRAAEWHALHGEQDRARELDAKAAAMLPAVLGLYKSGTGVWNAYHADGTKVELRHCVDFIYCGDALAGDLTLAQKSEMIAFVKRELFMPDWMRAMSLQDAAAAHSTRPDHSPMGAYDGWIPLTAGTMWRLGDSRAAYDFFDRTAVVTREGPFAQAHEFYGPDWNKQNAPVRIAERGGCMKECISGAAFADVVINTFFGFDPSPDGKEVLADPQTPRPFQGTLTALRYRGKLYKLTASASGLQIGGSQPR
jgi:hypothetical protein